MKTLKTTFIMFEGRLVVGFKFYSLSRQSAQDILPRLGLSKISFSWNLIIKIMKL